MQFPPRPAIIETMHQERTKPAIAAVVAAAGMSRRMGTAKQLLPWHGQTVISAVVSNLDTAGATPIVVVTGHRQAEVAAALAATPARTVYNADYTTDEMLRSYQVGIAALVGLAGCGGSGAG
ncbi:MAG TPA: NTP transferase domain-containing protein, partial [Caldilineaceae bacterium]|nr:NTP transferase domain-containing protein [Caldilineaceae bacterium]